MHMLTEDLQKALETEIDTHTCRLKMDGNHLELAIVSASFEGLSKLKRQQAVYKAIGSWIASGEVHAVHIHAYSPEEWDTLNNRGF